HGERPVELLARVGFPECLLHGPQRHLPAGTEAEQLRLVLCGERRNGCRQREQHGCRQRPHPGTRRHPVSAGLSTKPLRPGRYDAWSMPGPEPAPERSANRGALVLMGGTLGSRITGLIRNSLLTQLFSASVSDAFITAFKVPNLF